MSVSPSFFLKHYGALGQQLMEICAVQPVVRKQHNTGYKHKVRLLFFYNNDGCAYWARMEGLSCAVCRRAGQRAQLLHAVRGVPDAEPDRQQDHGVRAALARRLPSAGGSPPLPHAWHPATLCQGPHTMQLFMWRRDIVQGWHATPWTVMMCCVPLMMLLMLHQPHLHWALAAGWIEVMRSLSPSNSRLQNRKASSAEEGAQASAEAKTRVWH